MSSWKEFPASSGLQYLEPSVSLLSYLDLWPRRLFRHRVLNSLWSIYIRLMVLALFTETVLCLVNLFFTFDDVIVFAESLHHIILGLMVTSQWLLMKSKQRQLKRMFELFKHAYQQGNNMLGEEPFQQIWKSHQRKTRVFQWAWSFVMFGLTFQWMVYLLIPSIMSQFATAEEISTNGTYNEEERDIFYRFSYQAWYPFNKYISPNYELTVIAEAYLLTFELCVTVSLDIFLNSFMIYLKAHLETLIVALRCLPDDRGDKWPARQQQYEQQLFQTIITPGENWAPYVEQLQTPSQLDRGQKLSILQCIRHHKILIELFDMFSREMTYVLMANAMKSLSCSCLYALILMVLPNGEPKVFIMFLVVLYFFVQFLLYTWQAENVTYMSTKLKDAIYESAWVESGRKFRFVALIFMIRCNQIMVIPCGPFFKMKLKTAIDLCQFSFSLYTCLSQTKMMREQHQI